MKKSLFTATVLFTSINIGVGTPMQKAKYTTVYNDEFISSLLESVSYDAISELRYPIKITSVNIPGVKSISFDNGENKFIFYKSKYNTFIKNFSIIKTDVRLKNIIPIGESKIEVLKKLGVTRSLSILKVSDLEGGAIANFYFVDSKLQKITFNANVD